MKKYLMVCLVSIFLFLISAETKAFELKEWLEDIEGIFVVYVDDKIIIDDPDEIKICFLSEAEKYPGLSVQELFDKALERLPLGPRMVLIAAIFNIKSFSWMFLYTKELGCRWRS